MEGNSWNELAAWLLSNHTSPKLPTCPRARLEAQDVQLIWYTV